MTNPFDALFAETPAVPPAAPQQTPAAPMAPTPTFAAPAAPAAPAPAPVSSSQASDALLAMLGNAGSGSSKAPWFQPGQYYLKVGKIALFPSMNPKTMGATYFGTDHEVLASNVPGATGARRSWSVAMTADYKVRDINAFIDIGIGQVPGLEQKIIEVAKQFETQGVLPATAMAKARLAAVCEANAIEGVIMHLTAEQVQGKNGPWTKHTWRPLTEDEKQKLASA